MLLKLHLTFGIHGDACIAIDSDELADIKVYRALDDPIITHKYTTDWTPSPDNEIYSHITEARLHQAKETPIGDRISEATVPETTVYLSTATMDASYATPELVDIYQHAFREYLLEWTDHDPGDMGYPLNQDPGLNDYVCSKYQDIRRAIKQDRDHWFVNNRYDDLDIDTVPKAYWSTDAETGDDDGLDATTRQTVEDV